MSETRMPLLIIERNLRLPATHVAALSRLSLHLTHSGDFASALTAIAALRPLAIILCERSSSPHLQALVAHIATLQLPTRVISFVAHPSARGATTALRLGAADYISLREGPEQLVSAIARIHAGVPTISGANDKNQVGQPYHRLAAEYTSLQALMRDKDDFISLISHELRTPLMTVTGYLELLKKYSATLSPEKSHDFISRSLRATDELAHLADLLMQVLQFEVGQPDLLREPVALTPLVATAIEQCELLVAQHTIIRTVAANLWVQGDPLALQQILRNLLSNAIKYSPAGGTIQISAHRDAVGMVAIDVRDEGIGMTTEQQTQIFSRFARVHDQGRWPGIRGTGLGLYICRHIVTALGGRIWVESAPEQGSTFHVVLPAAARSLRKSPIAAIASR